MTISSAWIFGLEEPVMIMAKLWRIGSRAAVALAIGIGAAAVSPAHAEWHNGVWGHWGWHNGVRIFVAAPYPYGYYPYPYPYYAPGPVYYAPPPPPVVVPPVIGFGFTFGGHH
jgi:hypothetical protein